MWILDARARGNIELWVKDDGSCRLVREKSRPYFHVHLPDPHAYLSMLEALEKDYGAEERRFRTIHGWLDGYRVYAGRDVADRIMKHSHLSARLYDVDVRLEQRFMADGGGAYNRYYGRLSDGSIKTRGLMSNRHDSPPYVKRMQSDVLEVMEEMETLEGLAGAEARAKEVRNRYTAGLRRAEVKDLVVSHRISQLEYGKNCAQSSAIRAYGKLGIELFAGMVIGYVVRDSERWIVDTEWDAVEFDGQYYGRLLDKAWSEMSFAFERLRGKNRAMCSNLPITDGVAGSRP